jgi:hypothetical protein
VLVEDSKAIHDTAAGEQEVHAGATELRVEQGQVEAHNAETGQVATSKELGQARGNGREGRAVGHVVVDEAVDGGGRGRDGYARVDALGSCGCGLARREAYHHNLDGAVEAGMDTGGLDIDEGERPPQMEMAEHETPRVLGGPLQGGVPQVLPGAAKRCGWGLVWKQVDEGGARL